MILQSLVRYYETLVQQGKVSVPGWCEAKVSYELNLGADGTLCGVIPLKTEEQRGKKTVWLPLSMRVPEMVARSSGVSANFLCDNSKYFLGIDGEGSGKRVAECFEAAKKKHLRILEGVEGDLAEAVRSFFEKWNPREACEHPELKEIWQEVASGGNLVFGMGLRYAQDDEAIKQAWEKARDLASEEERGTCLVTGSPSEIARIHGTIKGVQGAQSSGAALVSFNAPAFESYGKEQSYNAPVGKYAAFAYTTALNYLLSQRRYVFTFGDTTVVFWAEDGETCYQEAFAFSFEPEPDDQEVIRGVFQALKENRAVVVEDVELDPGQKCFILGLTPNAARLSVRFFYQDSFGNILANLSKHYERMNVIRPAWDEREYLGVGRMLQETVNQNSREKKPQPGMTAGVFQAILSNGRYPESLYSNTMIRIRAEQGRVTRGRAGIIKAFLLRNRNMLEKGDKFVAINEEAMDVPYILGRIFAVLEEIQEKANPGINATIRDRYFNSACATPSSIFPVLLKLKNSHIRKLETGNRIYYESMLTELMGTLQEFPKRLNLDEQGVFHLGYYHQVQKRYTKKEEKKNG